MPSLRGPGGPAPSCAGLPIDCRGQRREGLQGVERPEGSRHSPQGDLSGIGGGQEGGVGLEGRSESEAEAPIVEGKGELGDGRAESEVGRGRVVKQMEGGKEHLAFDYGTGGQVAAKG
jgi:hypothetical protein